MLHIKVKIGEPLQSQAPEVRSDVPQQRPAAAPGLTKFLMTTACLWFYCGAAPRQRAEARTGKVGQLPLCGADLCSHCSVQASTFIRLAH